MATISGADKQNLNAEQQKQIAALKEQWASANAAGDQAGMDAAHKAAEEIRATAGYSGGAAGNAYAVNGVNNGGRTADQIRAYLEDYQQTNYTPGMGWTNGYSTAMNSRSKANVIRQQMQANSDAWHTADAETQKYLHEQNLALAQLLYDYTGQSKKNTWYDEQTGKWYTRNRNVGYGEEVYSPEYVNDAKTYYGYTNEQLKNWANDPSIYSNFVDTRAGSRATKDESSGYTGVYAQFVNGPYKQLQLRGTNFASPELYENVYGDGFYDAEDLQQMIGKKPQYDANGNPILTADPLKNNNGMDAYSSQFADYIQNGVIMPGITTARNNPNSTGAYTGMTGGVVKEGGIANNGTNTGATNGTEKESHSKQWGANTGGAYTEDGQMDYYNNYGQYSTLVGGMGGVTQWGDTPIGYSSGTSGATGSGGTYEDYINQMYDAALRAQLENLKSSYNQNVSELDASVGKVDDTYTEQKRQTTGTSAQQAANWREMANAYGLNSGAIGQAALAQNNQLQSNLNTLESAQASAQAEIERQRTLLGQQYQLQINQAIAENDMNRAEMLYQEAVRADEALRQQQQFMANQLLQYAQLGMQQKQWEDELALQYAKAAQSGSNTSGKTVVADRGSNTSSKTVVADRGPKVFDTNAMYEAMYQGGVTPDNAERFLLNAANQTAFGYGDNDEFIEQTIKDYNEWYFGKLLDNAANADRQGIPAYDFDNLKLLVLKHMVGGQYDLLDQLLTQYSEQLSNAQMNELIAMTNSMR